MTDKLHLTYNWNVAARGFVMPGEEINLDVPFTIEEKKKFSGNLGFLLYDSIYNIYKHTLNA